MLQMLKKLNCLLFTQKNGIFISFPLSFCEFSLLRAVGDLHMCNINLVMSCVQFHSYHHVSSL